MVPSLPLLFCESSVSLKGNPDRKEKDIVKIILNNSKSNIELRVQREIFEF